MPRKKLIRRFEPRYTDSQQMVDREAKYVTLEHADYLLGSIHDLHEQLATWQPLWQQVNQTAEALMARQGERESLAYRCMIVRDLYHIVELYCTCMRRSLGDAATDDVEPATTNIQKPVEEGNNLSGFSEWLFGTEA
jgi:hypothetical protein